MESLFHIQRCNCLRPDDSYSTGNFGYVPISMLVINCDHVLVHLQTRRLAALSAEL